MTDLVQLEDVVKVFPGTRALDGVSFTVRAGEIHALVGENGAGKSTLIKVLAGVWPHGSFTGRLRVNGEEQRFGGPADAGAAGIAVIYQELALIPAMTVAENLYLGREPTRAGIVDEARMLAQAQRILDELGVDVPPCERVQDLGVGRQQMVEIAKALAQSFRVLVLDEPTAALSDAETAVLHRVLRNLRQRGVGMVYISHRLREVLALADRITVLRDGTTVGTVEPAATTEADLIRLMVGREVSQVFHRRRQPPGSVLLEVQDLSVEHPRLPDRRLLSGISFSVRRGEVVGIAGLMGAGRTELLETVFGLPPGRVGGSIRVHDRPRGSGPAGAIAQGVALLSEDRKRSGLILDHSVRENTTLVSLRQFSAWQWLDLEAETAAAASRCQALGVRLSSIETPVRTLSGGNQQKVVFGKWLSAEPSVLLLDEPTRGIDVNAKAEVYALIDHLAASGCGIVLVASELQELIGLADRILVLGEGRLVAEFRTPDLDQEQLMAAMALARTGSVTHV